MRRYPQVGFSVAKRMTSARRRALLLGGDDTDRELARAALTETRLAGPGPTPATARGHPRAGGAARRDPPPRPRPTRSRPRAQGRPRPAASHRHRPSSRTHQASRHRPGQRRPGHRVVLPPRTLPQRRRVRRPRRRQPAAGQQRAHRATPPQPGRKPRPGPGDTPHRHDPDAELPQDPGLLARRTAEGKTPGRSVAASSGTSPASSTAPWPPP